MRKMLLTLVCCAMTLPVLALNQGRMHKIYTRNDNTRVEVDLPAFGITVLDGYESKKFPGKIYIQPPLSKQAKLMVRGDDERWVPMVPVVEPVYRKAALEILEKRGRKNCAISSWLAQPDWLAIEFAYTCES